LITEAEKDAIIDYLGGISVIDEDAILAASQLTKNSPAVTAALMDILQKNTVPPPELPPMQTQSIPQLPATANPLAINNLAARLNQI